MVCRIGFKMDRVRQQCVKRFIENPQSNTKDGPDDHGQFHIPRRFLRFNAPVLPEPDEIGHL